MPKGQICIKVNYIRNNSNSPKQAYQQEEDITAHAANTIDLLTKVDHISDISRNSFQNLYVPRRVKVRKLNSLDLTTLTASKSRSKIPKRISLIKIKKSQDVTKDKAQIS